MSQIVFKGWDIGAQPIPFIKLLHFEAGLSLEKARDVKDLILEGVEVTIELSTEEHARHVKAKADELGFKSVCIV